MNIPDAYAHPLFNPAIDAKTGFRTRNMLCCAVQDEMTGSPVAVLQARGVCAWGEWGGWPRGSATAQGLGCSPLPAVLLRAAGGGPSAHGPLGVRSSTPPPPGRRPRPPPCPRRRRAQALNKRGGADFSAVDEQHLKLFSVHLGNTLAKIRFYEEAK